MSRIIAAYDLDEDHGRLWVNADLKRMPDIVIVANQPMDRAQTVTYVPEARLLEALDENRRGTCHNTQSDFDFMCSECGKCVDNGRVLGFNYCPRCGRKVVE